MHSNSCPTLCLVDKTTRHLQVTWRQPVSLYSRQDCLSYSHQNNSNNPWDVWWQHKVHTDNWLQRRMTLPWSGFQGIAYKAEGWRVHVKHSHSRLFSNATPLPSQAHLCSQGCLSVCISFCQSNLWSLTATSKDPKEKRPAQSQRGLRQLPRKKCNFFVFILYFK